MAKDDAANTDPGAKNTAATSKILKFAMDSLERIRKGSEQTSGVVVVAGGVAGYRA